MRGHRGPAQTDDLCSQLLVVQRTASIQRAQSHARPAVHVEIRPEDHPDVPRLPGSPEEDEVSAARPARDGLGPSRLIPGVTRGPDPALEQDQLGQGRAVETGRGATAPQVGSPKQRANPAGQRVDTGFGPQRRLPHPPLLASRKLDRAPGSRSPSGQNPGIPGQRHDAAPGPRLLPNLGEERRDPGSGAPPALGRPGLDRCEPPGPRPAGVAVLLASHPTPEAVRRPAAEPHPLPSRSWLDSSPR